MLYEWARMYSDSDFRKLINDSAQIVVTLFFMLSYPFFARVRDAFITHKRFRSLPILSLNYLSQG